MDKHEARTSRVTNILVTNKDEDESAILRELIIPGTFTDAGGKQTIKIEQLEDESGDHTISVQDGKWSFSNDGGATEQEIGSGGGAMAHIVADLDDTDFLAESQSPSGAGNLTLTGNAPLVARAVTLTSVNNCSGVTFDIDGTDEDGDPLSEDDVTGPNNETVASANFFLTVTQIAVSGACTGIEAGMSVHDDPLTLTAELVNRGVVIEIDVPGGE